MKVFVSYQYECSINGVPAYGFGHAVLERLVCPEDEIDLELLNNDLNEHLSKVSGMGMRCTILFYKKMGADL